MKHILNIPLWSLCAAVDIFLHVIFIIYPKCAGQKFYITKKTDISLAINLVPLFGSTFAGLYKPLIYMCNIRMDSA